MSTRVTWPDFKMQIPGPHSRESGLIGLTWGPDIYIHTQVHLTQGPQDLTSEVTKYSLASVVETFLKVLYQLTCLQNYDSQQWVIIIKYIQYQGLDFLPRKTILHTEYVSLAPWFCLTFELNLCHYCHVLQKKKTTSFPRMSHNLYDFTWVCFYKYGKEMWITSKWFKISWRNLASWLGLGL